MIWLHVTSQRPMPPLPSPSALWPPSTWWCPSSSSWCSSRMKVLPLSSFSIVDGLQSNVLSNLPKHSVYSTVVCLLLLWFDGGRWPLWWWSLLPATIHCFFLASMRSQKRPCVYSVHTFSSLSSSLSSKPLLYQWKETNSQSFVSSSVDFHSLHSYPQVWYHSQF